MSQIDEFLEHHGVKGQKWGIRHDPNKFSRKDKKWAKNIYSVHGAIAVHNKVADHMNGGVLDKLNSKPKYKGKLNLDNENHPLSKEYMREYEKLVELHTGQAVKEVHGVSPSGSYKAKLNTKNEQWQVDVVKTHAQHAEDVITKLTWDLEHDSSGITKMLPVQDLAEHSSLEHHGVKGQKWGIRNKKDKLFRDTSKTTFKKPPAHLSDKELSRRIQRMQMEQRYNEMNRTKTQQGSRFAGDILKRAGTQAAVTMLAGAAIFAGKKAVEYIFKKKTGGGQLKLF